MKKLRLERQGSKDEFRFTLRGIVDGAGARALDQLLLQCLARDAREVHLDFDGVSEISALGLSVMQRHARAYEGTARRIVVHGIRGSLRESLLGSDSLLYAANGSSAEPEAAPETTAAPVPETAAAPEAAAPEAAAPEAAAPEPAAPEPAAGPSVAEHARLHAQLRRKIVEFRNLFEITQGLNLARDLDEVLNLFGLSVMGQFGVDRIALFLTDPDREGVLLPRQVRGFAQDHFRDMKVPIAAAESLAASGPFLVLDHAAALAPSAASEPMVGGGMVPGAAEVAASLRKSGLEWGVALFVRRDLIGILFLGGRGGRNGFQENERDLLTILAHQAAVAIANARFHRQMEERNLGLVRGMMSLIESRDVYAQGSTERVVRFVTAMARVLQVPREQVKSLIYGSVLRDIGMIAVSHLILKNPAHLSEEEWALIRQHPTRGAQLLEEMNLPREVVDVVLNHHERWGGEGYPFGIKGPEIPLGARIVSLVDAYVAMTSERPYRRALPAEKARQVISENWGAPFDPSLVDVFLAVLEKMERRSRSRAAAAPDAPADAGRETEPAALDPLGSGATIPVTMETDS